MGRAGNLRGFLVIHFKLKATCEFISVLQGFTSFIFLDLNPSLLLVLQWKGEVLLGGKNISIKDNLLPVLSLGSVK